MLSPNFNFLSFTVYDQIKPHLPKFANKIKDTTLSREVTLKLAFPLLQFYDAATAAKKFDLTKQSIGNKNNFTNIVAKKYILNLAFFQVF